jgi:hypothetical protein
MKFQTVFDEKNIRESRGTGQLIQLLSVNQSSCPPNCYARVSSTGERQSTERQVKDLSDYALNRQADVKKVLGEHGVQRVGMETSVFSGQ